VNSARVVIWNLRHPSEKPSRIVLPLPAALPENCFLLIRFSPDLNRLACGGVDGQVLVWNLQAPSKPAQALPGQKIRVSSLAFSADSNQLASAGANLTQVWDLQNPKARPKVFYGGSGLSYAAAFSPDGLRITDGFRIWEVRNPAIPPEVINQDEITINSLRFGKDGRRLAAFSTTDGGVQLLDVWSGLADYLCTRVVRNMSMDEWNRYVGPTVPYERTCPSLPPPPRGRGIH
jgi:WD40 repeat protein